jgi:HEPN domain-containing protein
MPGSTAMTKRDDNEIAELKVAIAKITGREPVSRDLRYLRDRIKDLKEMKREGAPVAAELPRGQVVMSISMHGEAKDAAVALAQAQKLGFSALVRAALAEYARTRGFDQIADDIDG